MLSSNMPLRVRMQVEETPNLSWLSGALSGLSVVGDRRPSWEWESFIEEIYDAVENFGDLHPMEPGCNPSIFGHESGSAYDVLGGYVSITGIITDEGFAFRLPFDRVHDISLLCSGVQSSRVKGCLFIPYSELAKFLKLVEIRGPLGNQLMEVFSY